MPKHETLRIRCDAQLKAQLDALAARDNRTMSNLALHVLTKYIETQGPGEPLRETPPPSGQPVPVTPPAKSPVVYPRPKRSARGHLE